VIPTSTGNPAAPAIVLSSNAFSFTSAGSAAPTQTLAATQSTNTTGFTLSTTTCAGIASVSPASGVGPFTVAALGAGTCSFVVTGAGGVTAVAGVSVTTTTIGSQ
jgi:hypothetical protein